MHTIVLTMLEIYASYYCHFNCKEIINIWNEILINLYLVCLINEIRIFNYSLLNMLRAVCIQFKIYIITYITFHKEYILSRRIIAEYGKRSLVNNVPYLNSGNYEPFLIYLIYLKLLTYLNEMRRKMAYTVWW